MDRSIVQQRLIETEEQIASAEHQIAQQRKVIAELEGNGRSAVHAKYLLAGLELLQAARRDSREALVKAAKALSNSSHRPWSLACRRLVPVSKCAAERRPGSSSN